MKNIKKEDGALLTTTVFLGVLSFFATLVLGLGLADVFQEYASPKIWAKAGLNIPEWLPSTSKCTGEWAVIFVCFDERQLEFPFSDN